MAAFASEPIAKAIVGVLKRQVKLEAIRDKNQNCGARQSFINELNHGSEGGLSHQAIRVCRSRREKNQTRKADIGIRS